jgi:hypothetical protein
MYHANHIPKASQTAALLTAGTLVASVANVMASRMNLLKKLTAALACLFTWVLGPVAHAVDSLNINVNVTITAIVSIAWYGNVADAANSTIEGNGATPTTLVADQTGDVTWALGDELMENTPPLTTVASGDDAIQFVVHNDSNCRVDYQAKAAVTPSLIGTTWTIGATPATNRYVMEISANGGATWNFLTDTYAEPDAALWTDHIKGALLPLELTFTPPTWVDNGGELSVVTVSVLAALG